MSVDVPEVAPHTCTNQRSECPFAAPVISGSPTLKIAIQSPPPLQPRPLGPVQFTVSRPPGATTVGPAVTVYVPEAAAGAGATGVGVGPVGEPRPQPRVIARSAITIPCRDVFIIDVPSYH